MMLNCSSWSRWRSESCSRVYEFPGDDIPVIQGSALKALEGDAAWEPKIDELMQAVDDYIPTPAREMDKPFLMPVEDIFTIQGRGTVATGRIERGQINVNEPVEIVGIKDTRNSVVTGVEMFKKLLDSWNGRRQRRTAAAEALSEKRSNADR